MPFEDIFSSLAKDLFILRGTKEDVDAWRRRLIYSALGKLALASVWDEEDDLPSVQHFSASIASTNISAVSASFSSTTSITYWSVKCNISLDIEATVFPVASVIS